MDALKRFDLEMGHLSFHGAIKAAGVKQVLGAFYEINQARKSSAHNHVKAGRRAYAV